MFLISGKRTWQIAVQHFFVFKRYTDLHPKRRDAVRPRKKYALTFVGREATKMSFFISNFVHAIEQRNMRLFGSLDSYDF